MFYYLLLHLKKNYLSTLYLKTAGSLLPLTEESEVIWELDWIDFQDHPFKGSLRENSARTITVFWL